jgi:hypothetical protein
MQFRLAPATGVGNFFSIAGWSSQPNSLHSPTQGLDVARTASPFEAVLEEGAPGVGERYRFQNDGQTILIEVTEVISEERDGREVQVVRGTIVGS